MLQWSAQRLHFFLTVRGIDVPTGLSTAELQDLVQSKKDVPIVRVVPSPRVLELLTPEQLADWLELRGFAVLMKGRPSSFEPDTAKAVFEELKTAALNDYREDYVHLGADAKESTEYKLAEILTKKASFQPVDHGSFIMDHKELDLDNILTTFGVPEGALEGKETKRAEAERIVNFFGGVTA